MFPARQLQAFSTFLKSFIRVFQLFCVSHYSIFNTKHHFIRLIYFITVATLHIFVMIVELKYSRPHLMTMFYSENKKNLMYYVSLVGLLGNFSMQIAGHLEPLFNRKHEEEIYKTFQEIYDIFRKKLNRVMDLTILREKFLKHTVVFFVSEGCLCIGFSFLSIPSDAMDIFMCLFSRVLSVSIIRARICLIAIHINILTHFLKELQIVLEKQQKSYRSKSDDFITANERIQYMQDIYSNIWRSKNMLSSCFGWSFIGFLLNITCELINSCYWTYINIRRNLMDMRNISRCSPVPNLNALKKSIFSKFYRNALPYIANYHILLLYL